MAKRGPSARSVHLILGMTRPTLRPRTEGVPLCVALPDVLLRRVEAVAVRTKLRRSQVVTMLLIAGLPKVGVR